MTNVAVHAAKTHLSRIEAANIGEEIVISCSEIPVARLVRNAK